MEDDALTSEDDGWCGLPVIDSRRAIGNSGGGVCRGLSGGQGDDAEPLEPPLDPAPALGRRDAPEAEAQRDVLEDRGVGEQGLLEHGGHAPAHLQPARARDQGAAEAHLAGGGVLEQADHAQEGRLAGPVRPDDRQDRSLVDRQLGDVERERSVVADGDVPEGDDRHGQVEGRTWMEPRWIEICQ